MSPSAPCFPPWGDWWSWCCFLYICLSWTWAWTKPGKIVFQGRQIINGLPFLERWFDVSDSQRKPKSSTLENSYLRGNVMQQLGLWRCRCGSVGGWGFCICCSTRGRVYDLLARIVHTKIIFSFLKKINWTIIAHLPPASEAIYARISPGEPALGSCQWCWNIALRVVTGWRGVHLWLWSLASLPLRKPPDTCFLLSVIHLEVMTHVLCVQKYLSTI